MSTDYNVWAWDASATPLNNATADGQINWSEGQDPATVNNSARAMMTAFARYLDATSGGGGAFAVGGTADAITITTGQAISSGHQALGFRICFKAASTNTGAVTVAVDGLSPVAIKRPNNDALSAGDIVSGAFHDIAFDGTNYRLFVPGAGGTYGSLSGGNTWTGTNIFQAGATVGDDAADPVVIKGTTVHSTMSALMSSSSVAALRTAMGLGTAATQNIGAGGATVPLLNGANTWSDTQVFTPASGYAVIMSVPSVSRIPAQIANTEPTLTAPNCYLIQFASSAGECGSVRTTGGFTTCTFNTSSDLRLKQNIRSLDNSGAIIDALQPRYWEWRQGGQTDFGLVAQEVAEIPEIAHTIIRGDDGPVGSDAFRPWQTEKAALVPILLAEIKALRARVAALEAG